MIIPNWPAPSSVKACMTERHDGGVSKKPYDQFNLASHVNDADEHVIHNRNQLKSLLHLPNEPIWLSQQHTKIVVEATFNNLNSIADASYSLKPRHICAILTADCLPILITNKQGNKVAAIHCGWRGLAQNIIEETLNFLNEPPETLLVWLGPAIGANCFEVGEDVYSMFSNFDIAFIPIHKKKWLMNIYKIAGLQLNTLGINLIYGGEYCTFTQHKNFFSYRRDSITGRMASLIWFE